MSSQQLPKYSGSQRGAAAEAYYQQWQCLVALKPRPVDAAMAARLFAFFTGAEPQSEFYTWCCVHVLPLARAIQSDARQTTTAAEQQAVYARHIAAYDRVFESFKATFCRVGPREFQQLLLELRGASKHNQGAALWYSLMHMLRRLQLFYSGVSVAGVVSVEQLLSQLLNTAVLLPDAVALRLKMAVDSLPPEQLPAAPANAPTDYNPRLTFQAVLAAVECIAKQHDLHILWGAVPAAVGQVSVHGSSSSSSSSNTSSQQSAVTSSSCSQEKFAIMDAASLSRCLGHLSAERRCQALAMAYPDDLCPEHSMLHALKDCPLVQMHGSQHVQQQVCSVAVGGDRAAQSRQEVQASSSSFATRCGDDPHDRPECGLCQRLGHVADGCWILHPGRCRNVRTLAGIHVPHHLRALFEQRLQEAGIVLPHF
jgi:hypothetical protein